jgi:hypothetical protein
MTRSTPRRVSDALGSSRPRQSNKQRHCPGDPYTDKNKARSKDIFVKRLSLWQSIANSPQYCVVCIVNIVLTAHHALLRNDNNFPRADTPGLRFLTQRRCL